MTEKISKIEVMYRYYKANPAASNSEVGQALGLSGDMVRTYKNRWSGYIRRPPGRWP